eukprot:m.187364 g.187364  ORF g.187364 m.187364 type:complete len:158 (+) comp32302_c1_seq2:626-1099(+)
MVLPSKVWRLHKLESCCSRLGEDSFARFARKLGATRRMVAASNEHQACTARWYHNQVIAIVIKSLTGVSNLDCPLPMFRENNTKCMKENNAATVSSTHLRVVCSSAKLHKAKEKSAIYSIWIYLVQESCYQNLLKADCAVASGMFLTSADKYHVIAK